MESLDIGTIIKITVGAIPAIIFLYIMWKEHWRTQTWDCGSVKATVKGKTLTISGRGAMADYDEDSDGPPWADNINITSAVIEDGVTTIGDGAFEGCCTLKSVTIPSSVKSIGKYAFRDCFALESITIPGGVDKIAYEAFTSGGGLASIDVSERNRSFCSIDGVLYSRDKSTLIRYPSSKEETSFVIPNHVKEIRAWAFSSCEYLTSITIPKSVEKIGDMAFCDCLDLVKIELAADNPNYIIEDGVLFNKAKDTLIFCDRAKEGRYDIPDGVKVICAAAFEDCDNLTEVSIPGSVTTIGNSEFEYPAFFCDRLESVTISSDVAKDVWEKEFGDFGDSIKIIIE